MQKKIAFLIAAMMMIITTATAQITTSSLAGKVTADGEDVIGATVEAVHQPSGTRYNAVTNAKGMYTINGMRVGGPYQVSISYIGYETKKVTGITLQLGETYNLSTAMNEDAKVL
ncbi:MAG: carboxypeptidase-like regulatory domain-containing protein, partial [Bacteroidales bacterium]|nr:carboxypeptidase-like regulatory domain-containing protein [Bacteroidales bacterium]